MKKEITTFFALILLIQYSSGQQIANGGFEQWDTIGDYTQPTNWYSLNALTQFGFDPTTTITNDAHSGKYAVVIETKSSISELAGVLSSSPILDNQFEPNLTKLKVPFSGSPSSMGFYFKSFPAKNDSSVVSMVLTKWNIAQQKTDTIATATAYFSKMVTQYTFANVIFNYTLSASPDSMFFIASSSADGFNPTVGSKFIIDDLQLAYQPISVKEVFSAFIVSVYPNPVNEKLFINVTGTSHFDVEIIDVQGRKTHIQQLNSNEGLDVSGLEIGIYLIKITKSEGDILYKRILIKH